MSVASLTSQSITPTVGSTTMDYSSYHLEDSKYQHTRLYPNQNTTTFTVGPTTTQDVEIQLPAGRAYNLSRSYIEFTSTPAAPAGNGWNWYADDAVGAFSRVQLTTSGAIPLVELNYANVYSQTIPYLNTTLDDFRTMDFVTEGMGPSNRSGTAKGITTLNDAAAAQQRWQGGQYYIADAMLGTHDGVAPFEGKMYTSALGSEYTRVAAVATAGPVRNWRIPLSRYSDTLFGKDINVMFPESMRLVLTLGPGNRWVFTSVAAAGAGDVGGNYNILNPIAIAGNITVTNFRVQLAVETNLSRVVFLKNLVASGTFAVDTNVVFPERHAFDAALTQHNIQRKLNSGHGSVLKRIYSIPMEGVESSNTMYDHNNIFDTRVISYRTQMDTEYITPSVIDCTTQEDYRYNRPLLLGTPLGIGGPYMYKYDWFHCDRWDAEGGARDVIGVPKSNVTAGLPLGSVERVYDFVATTTGGVDNFVWYTFAICQKTLVIDGAGPRLITARSQSAPVVQYVS